MNYNNRIILRREKQVSIRVEGWTREQLRQLARENNVPRGRNTDQTVANLVRAGLMPLER